MLREAVKNICSTWPEGIRDDMAQACWLKMFETLREHGPTRAHLLMRQAKYAAIDEAKAIESHGFKPSRSHHAVPVRRSSEVLDSIAYESHSDELSEHLLWLCQTERQRQIVQSLIDMTRQGVTPTHKAIAEQLGLSRDIVTYNINLIREQYINDQKT